MKVLAIDSEGAQVSVETGEGTVAVEDIGGNYKVTLTVEGFKYPVYGYVGEGSRELVAEAKRAQSTGEVVPYRIEVRRKRGISPSIPLADLDGKTQTRRLLASLSSVTSNEVTDNPVLDGDQGYSKLTLAKDAGAPHEVLVAMAGCLLASGAIKARDVLSVLYPSPHADALYKLADLAGVSDDGVSRFLNKAFGVGHPSAVDDHELENMLNTFRGMGKEALPTFAAQCA